MFRLLRLAVDEVSLVLSQEEADEGELALLDHSQDDLRTLCTTIPESIQNFTITFRDTFPSKETEESKRSLSQTLTFKARTLSNLVEDHAEQLRYGGEYLNNKRKDAELQAQRDEAKKAEEEAKKADEEAKHLLEEWKKDPRYMKTIRETRKFILDTYDNISAQSPDDPDYAPLAQFVQMVMDDAIPWRCRDQAYKARMAQDCVKFLREKADDETQMIFRVIFSLVVNSGTGHRLLSVTEVRRDYKSHTKLTIQAWRVAWFSKP